MAEGGAAPVADGAGALPAAPSASPLTPFALPDSLAARPDAAELGRVAGALRDTAGLTLAGEFVVHTMDVARSGAAGGGFEQGYASLVQKHGPIEAASMLATAREVIAKAAERWPGIHSYLDASGLGNDPRLVEKIAARAARRSST